MILNFFFFFTFPKKWVGRAMGNETFYGDGLSHLRNLSICYFLRQENISLRDIDSTDRAQRRPFKQEEMFGPTTVSRALKVQNSCYRLQVTLLKVNRKMLIQAKWSAIQVITDRLKLRKLV